VGTRKNEKVSVVTWGLVKGADGPTPDLHKCVGHRVAGRNVEDLRVENEFDARLTIADIRSDVLASNIYDS
jgi:hypothetical protein